MAEVTLEAILSAREERVKRQRFYGTEYSLPLVSFTMNIAGPQKDSPLIRRGFREGVRVLKAALSSFDLVQGEELFLPTGPEGYWVIRGEAKEIKKATVRVEENHPLGRLFDLDVILPDGTKMERSTPRSCLVCGRKGFFCASSRAHPVDEIQGVTREMLTVFFVGSDAEKTASLAVESLKEEVHTTPKPGLVDEHNNGSHKDMDLALFEASADALKPYFRTAFLLGNEWKNCPPKEAFSALREAGKEAEEAMFSVTDGVNTHKGAIFTLGLVCGALGRLWSAEQPLGDRARLLGEISALAKQAMEEDFAHMTGKTVGERFYLQEGIEGVRGEAKRGFPTVAKGALPLFEALLQEGLCRNAAAVKTLLFLIAETEDTNLLSRGGKKGAEWAKKEAKKAFLAPDFSLERVAETDRLFIEKNLSPGGSADLLALVLFLSRLGEREE